MNKILVCDDEEEIVEAIKIYLEEEEYQVCTCYNGEDAMKILKENEICLVLIDVMMPKLDGISVIRQIRKISPVPIIVISAKSQSTDKIIGLNAGADDYITKPFEPLELVARVKSHLRRYMKLDNKREETIQINGLIIDDKAKKSIYRW